MFPKTKASIYIEAFVFILYLCIEYIPNDIPKINKIIKLSSIGNSGPTGGQSPPGQGGCAFTTAPNKNKTTIKNLFNIIFITI